MDSALYKKDQRKKWFLKFIGLDRIHIFLCLVLPDGTDDDDDVGNAALCSNSVSTFILFSADIFFCRLFYVSTCMLEPSDIASSRWKSVAQSLSETVEPLLYRHKKEGGYRFLFLCGRLKRFSLWTIFRYFELSWGHYRALVENQPVEGEAVAPTKSSHE